MYVCMYDVALEQRCPSIFKNIFPWVSQSVDTIVWFVIVQAVETIYIHRDIDDGFYNGGPAYNA